MSQDRTRRLHEFQARSYRGIDYALQEKNCAEVVVIDLDGRLEAREDFEGPVDITAIDSPLGATAGFSDLLAGREPAYSEDGFQTRATERWARAHVKSYGIVGYFSTLRPPDFPGKTTPRFFNGGSHVLPTTGLRIVPACLDFVLKESSLSSASPEERLKALAAARRGEGRFVEAHPRLFLYSALERIYAANRESLIIEMLLAAMRYKANRTTTRSEATAHRRQLYEVLRDHPAWMGSQPRQLEPAEPPGWLVGNDHTFDAWLCALTGWAHDHSETLDWRAARIPEHLVEVEGHLLILDTEAETS